MTHIAVIGTGYVGLVAGACLAGWGHHVTCIDRDKARVDGLKAGKMPIYEPGLPQLVEQGMESGRLKFASEIAPAVSTSDVVFLAVGTPPTPIDGEADLTDLFDCVREAAKTLKSGAVIVTKSTVPVGTGDILESLIRKERQQREIDVASNPEFLREGSAVKDFTRPDRIVIGTESENARTLLAAVYADPISRGHHFMATRRRSAELIKYASNALLAAKITFINEIADLCEATDADVSDVAAGVGLDSRIGPQFLHAGPGYGGSCFPKDTVALVRTAQEYGVTLRLVEATIAANSARKRHIAMKVRDVLHGRVEGKKIAVLGLTFKADTDDVRESPALSLIEILQRSGAAINGYDPEGITNAKAVLHDVAFFDDPYDCAKSCDAVVFMTDWNVLKNLDLARLASLMRAPVMIDLQQIYPPEEAAKQGFVVETIGRTGAEPHPAGSFQPNFLLTYINPLTRLPVLPKTAATPGTYDDKVAAAET
jgi:UDPglucose 6-dehydrogenase